ncbi:Uncharacterized protein OS=Nitrosomonas europaea (strain ATCC 19718 / NBRC 14298) GN=NE1817 PE=4 SV=1: DUF955 [Gemmata massiliana]|uniref:IrrE N-terminal-like domain-containing protein n=1 Tax=Gemmata massiliana TaxID=1210884 RepID=A0A6P2D7Q4_9BACT|nr:ImmA/IrrE family metallo-endopeptidase [Gemmata massiliana]VTR97013.1 Uncharacterized protein OS=Nitrosomonas europaea (strain ATCC 19718 / NBRC 14298) GN=NE1817 PE=4 SV=1: DUF955 [Gemmata massiliana]
MINEAEALGLAEEHFPHGPEVLAERLGAEIRLKPINIDGWCLRKPSGGAVITLNSNTPETRRRFTLAHEVAHLILGTQSDIQGRANDIYDPRSPDEKAANRLGAEILLPPSCLKRIMKLPVDSKAIAVAAKEAKVSEVVIALRLFKMATDFQLSSPVIARLEESVVKWHMPVTYPLRDDAAQYLYERAATAGGTLRENDSEQMPILVCALSNPSFQVLFFYWLNEKQASVPTPWEQRKQLEAKLFEGDKNFQNVFSGLIGGFKKKAQGMTSEDAYLAFYDLYKDRFKDDQYIRFHSDLCQQYIRFRLGEYAKSE